MAAGAGHYLGFGRRTNHVLGKSKLKDPEALEFNENQVCYF